MPIKKVATELKIIEELIKKIRTDDSSADWGSLMEHYEKINVLSRENEWSSMQDAAIVAESLIQQIITGEAADVSQAPGLLATLSSAIEKLAADIEENGHVTISVKGVIAEARLFLGDFDYIPSEESAAKEESQTGDIDIFDEFSKRATNIENLVMDLNDFTYEESIKVIFREYHTLKGEAGFTGLSDLSAFCHKVESSIDPLRKKKISLSQEIIDLLLYFSDVCKSYIQNAQNSTPLPDEGEIDGNIELLKEQIARAKESAETPPPSSPPEKPEEEGEASEFASFFPLDDEEEGQVEKAKEESVEEGPPASPPAFSPKEEVSKPAESEKSAPDEAKPLAAIKGRRSEDSQRLDSGLQMEKVDALVEIAGELTIFYQTIKQSPEIKTYGSDRLVNDLEAMGRLFKDLQNLVMSIRMTSINPLFQRLNRIIRDSGRQEKKNIEVKMVGTNTIIDKNLLEDISGGLVHIVRNSVGHGIEPPRERIKAGKQEKGTITLRAFRDANNVVVEVSDDGKGLSKKKILESAREKGLVSPKADLDEQEIFNLLFLAGFSTAEKVTGLSGRGVGMDVVKSSIEKVRGKIELSSEEGKGTKIRLVLPFTFAIIEGLVVRSGKELFVIPLVQVHEMVKLEPQKLHRMKGRSEFLDIRGNLLPILRLHQVVSSKTHSSDAPDDTKVVVTIEHDHKMCGLVVDEVLASQEIVLKELKDSFSHLNFISAAGILGNRRIGLVLDVGEITKTIYSRIDMGQLGSQKLVKREEGQVEIVEIGTNKVAMIDFFIGWKSDEGKKRLHLAINAFKTKEFIPKVETTMLPKAPRGFTGVLTLRGKTIPVFSLGKLLMPNLSESDLEENLIIICEFSKKEVGFVVSTVNKVNYISWNEILPPPNSNNLVNIQNIVGTILKEKDIMFVLDFEKIIGSVMDLYGSFDEKAANTSFTRRKTTNTILLVEDSALMRRKIKEALERVGLKVIEATDGKNALDVIDKYYHKAQKANGSILDYIDLVLTDIEMPRLDGYTFTKTIKSHPDLRVLPVLLHSSLSNETIVQRAKEVRADGFISKCDPDSIFASLEKYL
jgi:two-component system chemotaxis sensor kinase CheA